MFGAWCLSATLGLAIGAGPGTMPPPPEFDETAAPTLDEAGPVEGPSRPAELAPTHDIEAETSTEPSSSGIELAPPPTPDPETLSPPADEQPPDTSEVWWPDPGRAPGDGAGFFVSASLLIPTGALVTWGLLAEPTLSREDRIGIIVAGSGMAVLGAIGLGLGISRRMKLVRWAKAYRVVPTAQGGGLLAAGGFSLSAALTLAPLGVWVLARGGTPWVGGTMIGAGLASGAFASLALHFGRQRMQAWQRTGGWYRRPLPQVGLHPRLLVTRESLGIGIGGQF